jgi:hypothetical protein
MVMESQELQTWVVVVAVLTLQAQAAQAVQV